MTPEQPAAFHVATTLVALLDALGIEHHLGGSWASSVHGVPRQTQDLDFVVDLREEHVATLVQQAQEAGFYAEGESARRAIARRSSFNLIHLETAIKVDLFVLGQQPFDRSEFERARPIELPGSGVTLRLKSPEDTVLRKLLWYRLGNEVSDRQWNDVVGCLRTSAGALDRTYLGRWAQELELEELLEKARREAQAPD